jgi:hypothetical protein
MLPVAASMRPRGLAGMTSSQLWNAASADDNVTLERAPGAVGLVGVLAVATVGCFASRDSGALGFLGGGVLNEASGADGGDACIGVIDADGRATRLRRFLVANIRVVEPLDDERVTAVDMFDIDIAKRVRATMWRSISDNRECNTAYAMEGCGWWWMGSEGMKHSASLLYLSIGADQSIKTIDWWWW